jgi:hypothetical protein
LIDQGFCDYATIALVQDPRRTAYRCFGTSRLLRPDEPWLDGLRCCNWWVTERRERWRRVRGPDGRPQWIKAADLRPKEGGQLSLVERPFVQTRISRSSAPKVNKQCLQVVGWLLMHHHRRLLAAQWQCSSTLFRWRPPPLLERRPPFADECSPRVGGRRANLLPVERRQCRPKPETGPAPLSLAPPAL